MQSFPQFSPKQNLTGKLVGFVLMYYYGIETNAITNAARGICGAVFSASKVKLS